MPPFRALPTLALLLACCSAPPPALAQATGAKPSGVPTTPSAHLGRPLAADFALASWDEVRSYFERLANESPSVRVETVGQTSGGRDFVLATISSPANLARLEAIRADARAISDPRAVSPEARARAIATGRPIVFVSCALHATEAAGPQFAMALAHELASSQEEPWASARERAVVLVAPSMNPDGQDLVVDWYRRTVGTPYEASALTELYQRYAGHDNNRDWFLLSQPETRIVTRLLYDVWRPQVYWDVHQQGQRQERMFVPPFRDPLNPNLDPTLITAIDALGSRALHDLTRWGLTGVSTGVAYDMWWNGGNRNVPVRHNMIGLLTEAASVDIASPVFLPRTELRGPAGISVYAPSNRFPAPWPGGWWRLSDIVEYELAFARSLLGSVAREPATWLATSAEAADRALAAGRDGQPRGWLIPADNADVSAVERLVSALLATGVEIERATTELSAGDRAYPVGTLLIRREQPYGAHVKDLFEVQRYPDGEPPYDVAGWTLPLLLGVRRVELADLHALGAFERVESLSDAIARFHGGAERTARDPFALADSASWAHVTAALNEGQRLRYVARDGAARWLLAEEGAFARAKPPLTSAEQETGASVIELARAPRIGLYAPWTGDMDEGWMRWVLDTYGIPYASVRNAALRAGALAGAFDVLVLPGVSAAELDRGRALGSVPDEYAGGIDPEGAVAVEEFVRAGGTLVAVGDSCRWAIELLGLPLVDVTKEAKAKEFSCPGSVVRAVPEEHALTAGLAPSLAIFFAGSAAWRPMEKSERETAGIDERTAAPETLLRYAPARLLLSGYVRAPEIIAGESAWVRATHGKGRVHLFGFRPQYRGWSQAAFPLLFRALLLEPPAR